MSASPMPQQLPKLVCIAPWRGPLQFGLLVVTALLLLALLLSYVLLVVALFGWMCWQVDQITGQMARVGVSS